ncbi:glycosyltransferase [Ruminococcaceae bacterium OttesenSCG-928-A11]|nr:glycosyltransferase [Ruminococcaceae bacterium OttesenSCG-928-A11]
MLDPYEISVVTPCHNMDPTLLEKAFYSLREQSLGFDKIEWIIVVHNSPDSDRDIVIEMVGHYSNVSVYHLNDGISTPASPRNYALDRAKGTYIGFLDADDTYALDVCEKSVKCLVEHNAQMVAFRIETESSTGKEISFERNILLNQVIPCHVIKTENWDSGLFTHGSGLGITSKVYDRRSINAFGLRFDIDVPFASDTLFNLEFFSKMETFCYLTQLIGYHYYMIGGSIVQRFNKGKEGIIRNAEGVKKILDYGLSTGLSVNTLMWELLSYTATLMMCSSEFSYSERKAISDMLVPFFSVMTPIKKTKLRDHKAVKDTMKVASMVLKHPKLFYLILKMASLFRFDIGDTVRRRLQEG